MAQSKVNLPPVGTGDTGPIPVATKKASTGENVQQVELVTAVEGGAITPIGNANPLPISDAGGSITVDGTVAISGTPSVTTGGLTDTQLRATAVPVSGTVAVSGVSGNVATTNAGSSQADGHSVTIGATSDASSALSVIGILKAIKAAVTGTLTVGLPSGASTAAKQPGIGTAGSANADVLSVQGITGGTALAVSGSFSASGTTDLTASGSLTASGQTVSITTLNGMAVCDIDVSGTYTHSLLCEGQVDGTNWFGITTPYSPTIGGSSINPTGNQILGTGRYQVNVAGYSGVRIRCSATGTGTAVVALRASAASGVSQNIATIGSTAVDGGNGVQSPGTLRVSIASDSSGQVKLAAGSAAIGSLTAGSALIGGVKLIDTGGTNAGAISAAGRLSVDASGVAVPVTDNSGSLTVDAPVGTPAFVRLSDGSAAITTLPVSLASVPSHAVTNAGTFAVQASTELATGLTTFSNTALSNTKTAVKAGAGAVYGWMIHNPSAATTFVQVWNVAIGSITVGTTAPTYVLAIPAGASANVLTDKGITHSTEINVAATTTATGSTAPATALVIAMWFI